MGALIAILFDVTRSLAACHPSRCSSGRADERDEREGGNGALVLTTVPRPHAASTDLGISTGQPDGWTVRWEHGAANNVHPAFIIQV